MGEAFLSLTTISSATHISAPTQATSRYSHFCICDPHYPWLSLPVCRQRRCKRDHQVKVVPQHHQSHPVIAQMQRRILQWLPCTPHSCIDRIVCQQTTPRCKSLSQSRSIPEDRLGCQRATGRTLVTAGVLSAKWAKQTLTPSYSIG